MWRKANTTLDIASGGHEIKIDMEKTVFSSEEEIYEFVRITVDLNAASSTFQQIIDDVFVLTWH